jgi:hypothetical protein
VYRSCLVDAIDRLWRLRQDIALSIRDHGAGAVKIDPPLAFFGRRFHSRSNGLLPRIGGQGFDVALGQLRDTRLVLLEVIGIEGQ